MGQEAGSEMTKTDLLKLYSEQAPEDIEMEIGEGGHILIDGTPLCPLRFYQIQNPLALFKGVHADLIRLYKAADDEFWQKFMISGAYWLGHEPYVTVWIRLKPKGIRKRWGWNIDEELQAAVEGLTQDGFGADIVAVDQDEWEIQVHLADANRAKELKKAIERRLGKYFSR